MVSEELVQEVNRMYQAIWSAEVELRQRREVLYEYVYKQMDGKSKDEYRELGELLDVDVTSVYKWRRHGKELVDGDKWRNVRECGEEDG